MFIFQGIASVEIWENKNITNSLKLNQIKKVLKVDPTIAESRAVDLANSLSNPVLIS